MRISEVVNFSEKLDVLVSDYLRSDPDRDKDALRGDVVSALLAKAASIREQQNVEGEALKRVAEDDAARQAKQDAADLPYYDAMMGPKG